MELATITMGREAAAKKLEAYEGVLRRTHEDELEAALEGYRALAEGTPLVDLDDVFGRCPLDAQNRPRMAIARADRVEVYMSWQSNSQFVVFSTERDVLRGWLREGQHPTLSWEFDMGRNHGQMYKSGPHWYGKDLTGFALVPMVPPDVLPQRSYRRRLHVLWEVEEWSDNRLTVQPDRDPYLLRHLGGSLFAIIGEWNLTDLERAVMRARDL